MKILIKKYDFFSTEPDCKTLALRTPTPTTTTTTTTANKQIKHARTITPLILVCMYIFVILLLNKNMFLLVVSTIEPVLNVALTCIHCLNIDNYSNIFIINIVLGYRLTQQENTFLCRLLLFYILNICESLLLSLTLTLSLSLSLSLSIYLPPLSISLSPSS